MARRRGVQKMKADEVRNRSKYETEISRFSETYSAAMALDLAGLKKGIGVEHYCCRFRRFVHSSFAFLQSARSVHRARMPSVDPVRSGL
jgi:hypothetical protein